MFGFLNVNKPKGITSHDVISRLRKVLHIKKIGHAGTLDPLAEGVLPIAISSATRLLDFLPEEKEYLASFQLGYSSSSYDVETELKEYSDKQVSVEEIEDILKNFRGEIIQKPPIYSAIKVGGKKLYEIARNGESLEIPERKVFIDSILLTDFNEKTQSGKILVKCSKGTYIRSIINDMGIQLGTGGVMTNLIRTKSGGMELQNSINLNEFIENSTLIFQNLIDVNEILKFPQYTINEQEYQKVRNGNSIYGKREKGLLFLRYNSKIIALAESNDDIINVKKVFNDD